jgi:hypothetical protein
MKIWIKIRGQPGRPKPARPDSAHFGCHETMGTVLNHMAHFGPVKTGSERYLRRKPICVEAEGANAASFERSRNAVDREVVPTVRQKQDHVTF